MHRQRQRRVFTAVLVRVLPVVAVLLLAIWGLVYTQARRALNDELNHRLATEAKFLSNATASKLDTVVDSARALAANHLVVNGVIDAITREEQLPLFFRSLRIPGPDGALITLTDYRGRPLASNRKGVLRPPTPVDHRCGRRSRVGPPVKRGIPGRHNPWSCITACRRERSSSSTLPTNCPSS